LWMDAVVVVGVKERVVVMWEDGEKAEGGRCCTDDTSFHRERDKTRETDTVCLLHPPLSLCRFVVPTRGPSPIVMRRQQRETRTYAYMQMARAHFALQSSSFLCTIVVQSSRLPSGACHVHQEQREVKAKQEAKEVRLTSTLCQNQTRLTGASAWEDRMVCWLK
jgi:hypothetical protein